MSEGGGGDDGRTGAWMGGDGGGHCVLSYTLISYTGLFGALGDERKEVSGRQRDV